MGVGVDENKGKKVGHHQATTKKEEAEHGTVQTNMSELVL